MFRETRALRRIRELHRRIKVIQGGTSAGKTIAILIIEINHALIHPNTLTSIVTDSLPNLRRGAMRDFLRICQWTGVARVGKWNKSASTFELPNGSVIEFFSADMIGSLGARRQRLFINEANRVNFQTFNQLEARTEESVTLDFNPVNRFWAHSELLEKPEWQDAVDFLKLTYKDNSTLPRAIIESIERRKGDNNWWRVYGLGEIGSLEGNIYQGWKPSEPHGTLVRYGLDFGFSNDPTALVAIREDNGEFHAEELLYRKGLTPSDYQHYLACCEPEVLIVADSARPELIAEIKGWGYRVVPCAKGTGSLLTGINKVQGCKISYTGKNLEQEFLTYAWRENKSGEQLGEPQDCNNHLMDAIRYAITDYLRPHFDF